MHSTVGNNLVILTQKPVYWDLPAGKLEKNSLVRTMLFPHQQGFESDSKACLPIAIDYLPTFAFEQGIVAAVPFANSTAVATPFAGVVGINNFKRNIFIKASAFKQLLELAERHSHNFFVEVFSFSGKSFKFFNANISIKLESHTGNFLDSLTKPVFNKIRFFVLEPCKAFSGSLASFVGKRLQSFFSFKNLFSFYPNVFAKVSLFQNLSFRGKDRNGKTLAIGIHSKNVFLLRQNSFFFGEISDNLPVSSKPIGFTLPSVCNKRGIPLKVPVLLNGNSQTFSGIHSKFNEEVGFCFKDLTVAGDIELDSNLFNDSPFTPDNISFNITNNLGAERGVFLAC